MDLARSLTPFYFVDGMNISFGGILKILPCYLLSVKKNYSTFLSHLQFAFVFVRIVGIAGKFNWGGT